MKRLLCLVSGHQRTLMPFTSNRFSCRRCGADLGRDIPAMPTRPRGLATLTTPDHETTTQVPTAALAPHWESGAPR